MPAVTDQSHAESQKQKTKLASSYNELLEQFSSNTLQAVGNYTLGRLIGKGTFGKVYLASHKLTKGSKVVLKSASKDDGNLAREIHHHRQFVHPHIARLYEVIVTETLVWLVLEYCPGDELYNYLLREGAIAVEKVQKIFTQLVGAVSYVHSKSCVHRDLKLENILLDKNENVKLCDFGFTREYEGHLSYLRTFCGTVCYSAPEMLRGEKYAGEKVDVWSLGIILYALLVGELPFDEDDDMVTKHKILSSEPIYPAAIPVDAKTLITQMLSKRPLVRPSLAEILTNPFLADHAPQQQAILKLTQPPPFATDLEKATLERMRGAGADIDRVIGNVLAQRCDPLAGWWALLIEKEDRKEKRREKKRREKEADAKNLRRLSAASSRLERLVPPLQEINEDEPRSPSITAANSRGRRERRSIPTRKSPGPKSHANQLTKSTPAQLVLPELPRLPEDFTLISPDSPVPPPPIEKDVARARSASSTQRRPLPPPKERRRSRGSTLQLVSTNSALIGPTNGVSRRTATRKPRRRLLKPLASIKLWFKENAKRGKSPVSKGNEAIAQNLPPPTSAPKETMRAPNITTPVRPMANVSDTPVRRMSSTSLSRPKVPTPRHRMSLSPAPITPRSSYRLSSGPVGLRGRKSTSSSVSSIRSIQHLPSHSKASSTSSTTNSVHSSRPYSRASRSPHPSVKVLPTTPTIGAFPSNIRLVRAPINYNESAGFNTPTSTVFAKRKKTPFRGPHLMVGANPGNSALARAKDSNASVSRSTSVAGRTSEEIIEEEDEDEVEEVDTFSPIATEVEETIWESSNDARSVELEEGWIRRRD